MAIDDVHAGSAHHYYAHDSTENTISERGIILVGVFVIATASLLIAVGYQLVKQERQEAQQRKAV